MKRVLFKIILPAGLLAAWMLTCYPVCNKADGFDVFLYWILVGCPYGLRKMCMILVPKNFGIAGSMGILALNCVWRSDRRGSSNLENGYGTCGDNKGNQGLLLDTMSKST